MASSPEDAFPEIPREPKLNLEKARKTTLLPGMTCIVTKQGSYGDFRGRLVKLVKNFPYYETEGNNVVAREFWTTEPPLKGPCGPKAEIRQLKFSPNMLMSVGNTQILNDLIIERREDCKHDPRIAGYILGRDAAYRWRQS